MPSPGTVSGSSHREARHRRATVAVADLGERRRLHSFVLHGAAQVDGNARLGDRCWTPAAAERCDELSSSTSYSRGVPWPPRASSTATLLQDLVLLGVVLTGRGDQRLRLVETGLRLHQRRALLGVEQPGRDTSHENLPQHHDDQDRQRQGGRDDTQVERRPPTGPHPATGPARRRCARRQRQGHQAGPAL